MARLHRAFRSCGVRKHPAKDVTGVSNGCLIGIDLVNGTKFCAEHMKLAVLLPALLQVLRCPCLTPIALSKLLGTIHWLFLLNRPLLSILHKSYGFARLPNQRKHQALPLGVQRELAMAVALLPFCSFDATKTWANFIMASDATPSYGFGLSIRNVSTAFCRRLRRLSEKRGDYVTLLEDGSPDPNPGSRLGNPKLLHLSQKSFRTLVSVRCKHVAHAGLLEAHAVRMALDWTARHCANHGTRRVLLTDARSVLGAVAKGRSSARTLRRQVNRISAPFFGGGCHDALPIRAIKAQSGRRPLQGLDPYK